MSALSNWLWGSSQLDEAIDKATSELLPAGSEDIALNLEICDQIRSKSVPAKDAMRALKRRLNHKNPNVQLLALSLTDICVKNGGDHFLVEVASREFIDNIGSILRIPTLNLDVKNTILRVIQNWSIAFEGKPSLGYVGQVCRTLQSEGFKFPPKDLTAASSAMVDTQTAPEWIDSDVCLRCRTPFTFTNRKHHCRNCGQVFDQACSSKTMALPHFGIAQEVRVCDGCYNKMTKRAERGDRGHRHSASLHSTRHRSARDLADAELQRAIQLSLQEVGAAGGRSRPGYVPSQPTYQYSEPPIVDRTTHPSKPSEEDDDPDLKAAIEASLREANAPRPSAPIVVETPRSEHPSYDGPGYSQSYPPGVVPPHPVLPNIPNYDLQPIENDAILTFNQTVEQVQAQGGRDMSRYPAVNELYEKANSLRPKLAMSVDDAGRKEQMLSEMHDKLSQAVKLYDQLLSQQVAQPRWRSPEPAAAPYAPMNGAYAPANGYAQYAPPANGYSQWAPNGYQPPAQTSPPPQPSYFPPQEARTPTQESQMQWYAEHQSVAPQMQQPSAPSTSYAPQTQPAYEPQPQPQLQPTPSPAPVAVAQFSPQSPPPQQYAPHQQYTAPSPQSPPTQQYASSSTQAQFQSMTPTPGPSSSPSLSRHNTVSYAQSAPSQPPAASASLGRSNTVSHPMQNQPQQPHYQPQPQSQPPHQSPSQTQSYAQPNAYAHQPSKQPSGPDPPVQHQYQYQQPQQYYTPSAPPPASSVTSLAQFPVAPTSAPQAFPLYGAASIPSGVAQTEERKEALLIDL